LSTQPRRPDGRFGVTRTDARAVVQTMARRGVRGLERAFAGDRALANALRDRRQAMIDELGGMERANASALALIDVIVRSQLMVDTLDVVLLELGPKIVNKRLREVYPLVEQRQKLADSLAQQLKTFNELKAATQVEARLRELEAKNVVG
jgi:nucleoside-triphosphatase THEP1